jgi:acyl-CoA reductase-like NAD-dependent aldehyde dehydrogenase
MATSGRLLCGGSRAGATVEATLLEDVPKDQPLCAEEAFGPVAVLSKFTDFGEALREVNDSVFGLQAGVFKIWMIRSAADALKRILRD